MSTSVNKAEGGRFTVQDLYKLFAKSIRKKMLKLNLVMDTNVHRSEEYSRDPFRIKCLVVHNAEPFVAETPGDFITKKFYT